MAERIDRSKRQELLGRALVDGPTRPEAIRRLSAVGVGRPTAYRWLKGPDVVASMVAGTLLVRLKESPAGADPFLLRRLLAANDHGLLLKGLERVRREILRFHAADGKPPASWSAIVDLLASRKDLAGHHDRKIRHGYLTAVAAIARRPSLRDSEAFRKAESPGLWRDVATRALGSPDEGTRAWGLDVLFGLDPREAVGTVLRDDGSSPTLERRLERILSDAPMEIRRRALSDLVAEVEGRESRRATRARTLLRNLRT